MDYRKYSFAVAFLLSPSIANAQEAANPERIADMMVRLCVGGGHSELIEGGGGGGANLSVRTFDINGNITGQFKVTKSSAEGLVSGINNAMSEVTADTADKVRTCLQPVRDRLLDVMLPKKQ